MDTSKKKFSGYLVFIGCVLLMLFPGGLLSYTSGLFMYSICAEFNFSLTSFSLTNVAAAAVNALVSAFLVQYLSKGKRGQMKWLIFASAVVTCGGYYMMSRCTQIWQFVVMSGVWNLGYNMLTFVPCAMMMNNWFVKNRSTMVGIVFACSNVGGAIFSTVISQILANQGWRMGYVVGAACCFVSTMIALLFLKRSPEEYGETALGADEVIETADGQIQQKAWVGVDKKIALKSPALYLACAAMLLTGIYAAGIANHVCTFLCTGSWEITAAGFVMTVFTLVGIIGNAAGGGVLGKIGSKKAIYLGAGLLILGVICLTFANNIKPLAYVWCVCQGLAIFMCQLIPTTIITETFGTKDFAGIYGITYACYLVGCAISTTVVAFIAEATSYTVAWIAIIVIIAVLAVLHLACQKQGKIFRELYPN